MSIRDCTVPKIAISMARRAVWRREPNRRRSPRRRRLRRRPSAKPRAERRSSLRRVHAIGLQVAARGVASVGGLPSQHAQRCCGTRRQSRRRGRRRNPDRPLRLVVRAGSSRPSLASSDHSLLQFNGLTGASVSGAARHVLHASRRRDFASRRKFSSLPLDAMQPAVRPDQPPRSRRSAFLLRPAQNRPT